MRPLIITSLALLVTAATILLLVQVADAQTDPPATGDWTIGDNTTLANQTVRLRGNLTIVPGGRLTLLNVTLQVFSDMNAVHGILVMANGTLELSDLDGRPSTKGDRTVVMRGNPSFGYSLLAEKDSLIFIEYSLLSGMGANGGTGGALFRTSGFKLIGTTFLDGYDYCLMLDGSEDSVVDTCDFISGKDGLVLKDCVNITVDVASIEDNDRTGLVIDECEGTVVTNSNISFNGGTGVQVVGGSKNEVDKTQINGNDRGVVLITATWFTLSRCTINSPMMEGIFISVGCHNVSIENTTIRNAGRSGIEAEGADNLTIFGTIIENSSQHGMRLVNGSRSVSIAMRAWSNDYDGLHIEGARDIVIQGQYLSNGYNGMFLIDAKNVTVRGASFKNNSYDGLNCDNVRDAIIQSCISEMNGYLGVNIQAGSHDIRIIGGGFNENTRSGLSIDSARSITVDGVTMWSNGGYGLRIEEGASDMDVGGWSRIWNNTEGAIYVEDSNGIRVNSSFLEHNVSSGYLLFTRNSGDIWVTNSTANGTARLRDGSNVAMVNCTFEDISPDVDATSWLKFGEFVTVVVKWPNGEPVTGAAVNATGGSGEVLARGITNATGSTEDLIVLIKTFIAESIGDENPITFWARKGVEVARNVTNLTQRTTVNITLQDDFPPVAVAPDLYTELGERATLNGSASHDNGELVSWVWTFDDGVGTVVMEGRVVRWTFTVLGDFTGQLNVSDSVSLWNVTTFTINVTDTTPPDVLAGENATIDQGEWVSVDGTSSTDNDSTLILSGTFVWRVIPQGPGTEVRTYNGLIASIQFPEMGVFKIVLKVTDQSGNYGEDELWVTVRDITPPEVDAGPDTEVDEGSSVTIAPGSILDNDPAFDANLTAFWHVSGPDTDMRMDGLVLVFIAPGMGEFQATLHVTDAAGNEATDSLIVTALDKLPPIVDIGSDTTVEVLTVLTFNTSGTTDNDPSFPDGASYRWRISGPQMDEEHQGDSISFPVPWIGEYVIELTVTDAAGNEGSTHVTVTSVDTADPEFGAFSPTHLDTSEGGDVSITFVITDVGTGIDVGTVEMRTRSPSGEPWTEWQKVTVSGSGFRLEETMVIQFPEGDSIIQLRCMDWAGNGPVVSDEHLIRVNSRPVVIVLSPADEADYGPFDEIKLDASASSDVDGDDLFYRWSSDVDGLLGTSAEMTAPPLTAGTHRITVLVSDEVDGHDVLVGVNITVRPVPSTVSPDEDIPWWILVAAILLLGAFAFVVRDYLIKRKRPPSSDEGDEWVETP